MDLNLHCLPDHIADTNWNENQWIDIPLLLRKIKQHKQPPLSPNPWIFERTIKAAKHNSKRLAEKLFDMETATQEPPNTSLSYGAEFKPAHVIQPLLHQHPQWPEINSIISNGATYPLHPITEKERKDDIKFMLKRGNHQSAKTDENKDALSKSFDKEVASQWAIPITIDCIKNIPHACITPLGVATQWSINEKNERYEKKRTTHDCTFPGMSGNSCNKRVIKEELSKCRYGHALLRFLHGIHDMRRRHPDKPILMSKTDMDAAYRRIHTQLQSAVTCITILGNIAYLLLRLPFGSAPAPSIFGDVSDTVTDLAQDLALDPTWDPQTLQADFEFLDLPPVYLNENVKYEAAGTLAVELPPRDIVSDNFIDDIFQAGVDLGENRLRIIHSVPLALEAITRPIQKGDDITRNTIISMKKHFAEGRLSETKTILGWNIDTRRLRVLLTPEKCKDWVQDIQTALKTKGCSKGTLETMIGRFNHVGVIIHVSRYFLSRLRYRLEQNREEKKHKRIHFTEWEFADLKLWEFFLTHLRDEGVSINNICTSKPTGTTYSDACEWGLGGFTLQGRAWRYYLPSALLLRGSINLLEFLAAILTIKISIEQDDHKSKFPHILAFTDNSSAVGWLYHSTFNPVANKQHDTIARYFAKLLFLSKSTLYPEHIPGKHNIVADSLSRDSHLSDEKLTQLILSSAPLTQIPQNFKIYPLPAKDISWIASMLGSLTQKEQSLPTPAPSTLALFGCSKSTYTSAGSRMTHSWTPSKPTKRPSSSLDSPIASAPTNTAKQTKPSFKATLSKPPSDIWFRPSGRTYGLTQPSTSPA